METMPPVPEFCPVFPWIRLQKENADVAGFANSKSPSLDRIVGPLGYVPGNVRVISSRANSLRNDATLKEMKYLWKDARRMRKVSEFLIKNLPKGTNENVTPIRRYKPLPLFDGLPTY
jgi:hypothetical protein